MNDKIKFAVVSLGCDKNRVDTEGMLCVLLEHGFELTTDQRDADVIIVNTCAFLESARQEAIETAIELSKLKLDRCKLLVLTGCLPQRFGDDVFNYLTEADVVVGINDYEDLGNIIENALLEKARVKKITPCSNYLFAKKERVLTTPKHYAYLKTSDGCNNFCSYCLIPFIRGRFRSRTIQDIVDEAKSLVDNGVKELILVAQDTTRYGIDLYGEVKLIELIRELSKIENLVWIRLLYCYPELITDQLIEEINNNPKVCKYIDVPLQHVSNKILKRMNRRNTKQDTIELFEKLKSAKNHIAIRTTFICGFPGEDEETFAELCDFVRDNSIDAMGAFAFSREEGTRAFDMDNQIDFEDSELMCERLYSIQQSALGKRNLSLIGKTVRCVIDGFDQEMNAYFARSQYQAPDVDSVVWISNNNSLKIGEFYECRITDLCDTYDFYGEIV